MKATLRKCWKPAQPIRRPDKIISSDSRMKGDLIGFTPTYESDKDVNMFMLLSNEYQRKWFEEKVTHDTINFAQIQTFFDQTHLRRRIVQKDYRRRVHVKKLPPISLKRFQNIPSKTDHRRPSEKSKKKKPTVAEDSNSSPKAAKTPSKENKGLPKEIKKDGDAKSSKLDVSNKDEDKLKQGKKVKIKCVRVC